MDASESTKAKRTQELKTLFAAELFSKLAPEDQDEIIARIEALLSREE